MMEFGNALAARLTADTLSSPIDSISGANVTLSSGEGLNWALGDRVNFDGDNEFHVTVITAIATDVITVGTAPANAAGVGDVMQGGYVEWFRPAAVGPPLELSIYFEPTAGEDPSKIFEDVDASPLCICRLGFSYSRPTSEHRQQIGFRIRVTGKDQEYIDGATGRILTLLNGDRANLVVKGYNLWVIEAGRREEVEPTGSANTAGLIEYDIPVTGVISLALA